MPQSFAEQSLIWYARRFPLRRGKLRIVDALWGYAVQKPDRHRVGKLAYGGYRVPCDLTEMIQRQLYFFGTYFLEDHLLRCWTTLAKDAQVVFDVGANAGIYSLAALAANSAATVHAFEPTPEIAERLRVTAEWNQLPICVHQMAVLDRVGLATLVRCRGGNGSNEGMNFVTPGGSEEPFERVPTQTLDEFCQLSDIKRIDLLKIDIQGSEYAALVGAKQLLLNGRIKTIFMELNWAQDDGRNCPASQSIRLLSDAGYRFSEPGPELVWRIPGEWMREISDVIACDSTVQNALGRT